MSLTFARVVSQSKNSEILSAYTWSQVIHKATLQLKLVVLLMAKQLQHDAAFRAPTLHQLPPAIVMARVSQRPLWTSAMWRAWCLDCKEGGPRAKASLPVSDARRAQAVAVRAHLLKRPAAFHKRPSAVHKRTPFKLQRHGGFITQGVKRSAGKRPA